MEPEPEGTLDLTAIHQHGVEINKVLHWLALSPIVQIDELNKRMTPLVDTKSNMLAAITYAADFAATVVRLEAGLDPSKPYDIEVEVLDRRSATTRTMLAVKLIRLATANQYGTVLTVTAAALDGDTEGRVGTEVFLVIAMIARERANRQIALLPPRMQ